jgi:hypothetical protein
VHQLQTRGVTHLYICGLALDDCVAYSALHSAEHGFNTTVVEDACRGVAAKGIAEKKNLMREAGVRIAIAADVPVLLRDASLVDMRTSPDELSVVRELIERISLHTEREKLAYRRSAPNESQ